MNLWLTICMVTKLQIHTARNIQSLHPCFLSYHLCLRWSLLAVIKSVCFLAYGCSDVQPGVCFHMMFRSCAWDCVSWVLSYKLPTWWLTHDSSICFHESNMRNSGLHMSCRVVVDSHGMLSLLFIMKVMMVWWCFVGDGLMFCGRWSDVLWVMVWCFVGDAHKVMTTMMLIGLLVLGFAGWTGWRRAT
jgi:hypothetical protein